MPMAAPTLTTAIKRMGPAELFVGNPMVAASMLNLGILEGERRAEIEYGENRLTMPEITGDVAHDITTAVSAARIVSTLVLNGLGATIWPKITPDGTNAGGGSYFKKPVTTCAVLIPRSELGKSLTWDVPGTAWKRTEEDNTIVSGATAAPIHSIWLWKAWIKFGPIPFGFEDGGKSRVELTIDAMYDDTKPEGAKVFLIGDPRAFTTPILVLP